MTPKVCLVMIVRDESAILRDRLLAVRDEVDAFCILDTGSVDDTPNIVCDVFAHKPGRLGFRDWAGFADARTAAVAGATEWAAQQESDDQWWALLLDADTIAHFAPGWRKCLWGPVDAVSCDVHHGTLRYSHPRLLRLGACDWTWRGVLHEYLEVPASMRTARTEALLWVEHGHGGARERDPDKFKKDAAVLEKARADNVEPWLDSRYCFYLAQSYRDAGMIDESIATYIARAQMGGWIGEQFVAYLRAGEMVWGKQNWAGAHALWIAAWSCDPNRAEALIGLASLERVRQMWVPCYEHGRLAQKIVARNGAQAELFADTNVLWRADFEVAIAGSWVNTSESKTAGRAACLKLINGPYAPAEVKGEAKRWLKDYYGRPVKAKKR